MTPEQQTLLIEIFEEAMTNAENMPSIGAMQQRQQAIKQLRDCLVPTSAFIRYNTKPGERKTVIAKVDTRHGNSDTVIKAGHTGYALGLRVEDQQMLIKWKGVTWPSNHPVSEIEPTS